MRETAIHAYYFGGWRAMSSVRPVTRALVRWRRRTVARNQELVAITGSLGKTTTVRCTRAALGLRQSRAADASLNVGRSIPLVLLPENPWRRFGVVEIGLSTPGSIAKLVRLVRPTTVVMTSVGHHHEEEGFAGLQAIRDEKAVAVRMLPASGTAILNADQPEVASMAGETRARVVTFGLGESADVRAINVAMDWPRGTTFDVVAGGKVSSVRIQLLGRAGVLAAVGALAVAHAHGVPMSWAAARLTELSPTKRRNEPFHLTNGGVAIVDDSKASPESLAVLVELSREAPVRGRRVFLVGNLKPKPAPDSMYREVAEMLAPIADLVVVCGVEGIQAQYRRAFQGLNGTVVYTNSVAESTAHLSRELSADDALFIKATGHVRLGRVAFALAGRRVTCARVECEYAGLYCHTCPLLTNK